jgi:hypothetical protein
MPHSNNNDNSKRNKKNFGCKGGMVHPEIAWLMRRRRIMPSSHNDNNSKRNKNKFLVVRVAWWYPE